MTTQLNGFGDGFQGETNEQIGEFCLRTGRKMAKDVYVIAKAIQVVHRRLKDTKGEFGAWREKYIPFISKATVYRYLSVAELDPAQIGETEGITDLYKRFLILPAKPPVEPTEPPVVAGATGSSTAVTQTGAASHPGGAATADAAPPTADEIGRSVPDADPTGPGDVQAQDEDSTPEQDAALRAKELAAALVVAGKLAAKHGVSGDPHHLIAFLGEFGVEPEDIGALAAA